MIKKLVAHLEPNIEMNSNGIKTKYKIKVPLKEINKFLDDGFEVKLSIPSFDYKIFAGKKHLHRNNFSDVIKIIGVSDFYSVKYFCKISNIEITNHCLTSPELLSFIKEQIDINYNPLR